MVTIEELQDNLNEVTNNFNSLLDYLEKMNLNPLSDFQQFNIEEDSYNDYNDDYSEDIEKNKEELSDEDVKKYM